MTTRCAQRLHENALARLAAMLAAMLLASACALRHVTPEHPAANLPDRSGDIAIGAAQRDEVRRTLGAPVVSSQRWSFDLFRASTTQHETAFAITPWPVPFARLEDEIVRYTLVTYRPDGSAGAVASGLYRRPPAWRNTSPIEPDLRALHLRAGDLLFFVDPEGSRDVNLLAAPRLRDTLLAQARRSQNCIAVAGCVGRACPDRVAVDGAATRALPLRGAHAYWTDPAAITTWLADIEPYRHDATMPWLEILVALDLPAGEHVLVWSARTLGGSASTVLNCRPGEVTYLAIDVASEETFWSRSLKDWRIAQSDAMPAPFRRRTLVLVYDGRWIVEAEAPR